MLPNTVILVFSFIAYNYVDANPCNKGPAYWCTSLQTATECGVVEYCQETANLPRKVKKVIDKLKAAPPVNISLYYESLCPGCRHFLLTQLYPTYQHLKASGILNVELYPYGNAEQEWTGKRWRFTCQHGPVECEINMIETCALHLLTPTKKLPFIHCIENDPSISNAKLCAAELRIEWDPIHICYNGSEGNYLQHQVAQKTNHLKPRHRYVPWITSEGVHTDDIQNEVEDDMLAYVCQHYTGVKPVACQKAFKLDGAEKTRRKIERCYQH